MRILVLSFYYAPDLSAGSFRTTALVHRLSECLGRGDSIDVVTTLPNRYSTFNDKSAVEVELHGLVRVQRIALPVHKSGMADQSRAFARFAKEANRLVRARPYDLVYATSSRLMTAALGAWIARRQRTCLYLDIRDIFVDTIRHVLPTPSAWALAPLFSLLERWTVARACRVNLVSGGFRDYFAVRYPHVQYAYFSNGVDREFLEMNNAPEKAVGFPKRVLYAGNIGEGQGLHNIVPPLAKRMGDRVAFTIIGDGGRRSALENALKQAGVGNVELLPPTNRNRLIEAYQDADVLFLHLNDYEAFKKVLPSKIFEYAATGKPIWAGVAGYAADFIMKEISNAAVFRPADCEEAEAAFNRLRFRRTIRSEFTEKYSRDQLMRRMAEDVIAVAKGCAR